MPYPRDIAKYQIDQAADWRFRFYRDYEWPLKALLLLLLGALAWAVARWDQYRRARVVAELRRPSRPPYVWQPDTGQDAAAQLAPALQVLLARLRGRAPGQRRHLDVPATIRATSRKAGRIHFVYRRRTLPPDYLLLIDRLAANDHRAHLFDSLYQVFLRAEAPVARYFYEGDPRLLFDEDHPEGIPLGEALHRHDGAQLVIVGEGERLLSPNTGRPALWTQLLAAWPRRVLLTPRPRLAWGPRERQLEELLPLLPASPGGLEAALDLFASEDPDDTRSLLPRVGDALRQPFAFRHDLMEDLQRHFPQPIVDWIAACAIWPALHWDLTLHLGRSLGEMRGEELITFENLRELTRLPWFAEGRLPEAPRGILLDYLAARGLEEPLRQSLRGLLQQVPAPPEDSAAYDDYRMNLILNELFLRPDAATRRRLEREYARYLAAGKKPDFVALRLLGREPTRLDVLLGGALKKFAFREGLPGLGWRLAPRLLAAWAVLAAALLAFRPDLNPCPEENRATYQDMQLCLDSDSARLLYLEYLAGDAILEQDTQLVDSLRGAADAIRPLDTAFYRNTATRYHNYAARAWNCALQPGPDCDALPADSLRTLVCANFRRGGALSEMLLGRMGIQYASGMQRACPAAEPLPAFFSLGGRVVSALDGKPVAGAAVRLGDANQATSASLAAFSASTNAAGHYAFDSLPAMAQLRIYVAAPGYEPFQMARVPSDDLPDIRLQPTAEALEAAAWERAGAANTPEAYSEDLAAFPAGIHAAEARQKLADFASARELAAWQAAQQANTIQVYDAFLREYPNGAYASTARQRLAQLQDEADWQQARAAGTPEACRKYLEAWPQGGHVEEARKCADKDNVPRPQMVLVPGGEFRMGDVMEDNEYDREKPLHDVNLDGYYIGRYEVAFEEYDRFCEATGREKPDDRNWGRGRRPVINVSWNDAVDYCNWLSGQHGYQPVYSRKGEELTANWRADGYRLPTEAEWEYAARQRGQNVRFGNGKNFADPKEINFNGSEVYKKAYSVAGEYRGQTIPVGSLNSPNSLGLHDMSGNVYEWCWDWYGKYPATAQTNPRGPGSGSYRVLRGGSWFFNPTGVRCANRADGAPDDRYNYIGFRLARAVR